MIIFKDCYISRDNKHIILNIKVSDLSYYENVFLKAVYVDTKYNDGVPSATAFYQIDLAEDGEYSNKQASLSIDIDSIADNLFFIWVDTIGEISEGAPCDIRNGLCLKVLYDPILLYNKGIAFIKEVNGACTPSDDFQDYLLQYNAFKLALAVGDYQMVSKLWNDFYKKSVTKSYKGGCGCGRAI